MQGAIAATKAAATAQAQTHASGTLNIAQNSGPLGPTNVPRPVENPTQRRTGKRGNEQEQAHCPGAQHQRAVGRITFQIKQKIADHPHQQ